MKKLLFFVSLCSLAHLSGLTPRTQSMVTSLNNSLQQLKMRYNPSLAQGIQKTIRLLQLYEPSAAQEFQNTLNGLAQQYQQPPGSQLRQELLSLPQPEPLPAVKPEEPQPPIVPVQQPLSPPSSDTAQPSEPVVLPPSDLPPVPTIEQRPLPTPPEGEPLKNLLTAIQQRTLKQLQKYLPNTKNKKLPEVATLVPTTLKEGIRGIIGKNKRIMNNTKDIAAENLKATNMAQFPAIEGIFDEFNTIDTAIMLYTILYGSKKAELLISDATDIKNEFVTVTFENAIIRVRQIQQNLNDMGSLRTAFNSEEITNTFQSLIQVHSMIIRLQELHLLHIARYLQTEESPSSQIDQLTTELQNLFERLRNMLSHLTVTFEDTYQDMSLPLKLQQLHCYELAALSTQMVVRSLLDPISQSEEADLNKLIQDTIAQMRITILKLRVTPQK